MLFAFGSDAVTAPPNQPAVNGRWRHCYHRMVVLNPTYCLQLRHTKSFLLTMPHLGTVQGKELEEAVQAGCLHVRPALNRLNAAPGVLVHGLKSPWGPLMPFADDTRRGRLEKVGVRAFRGVGRRTCSWQRQRKEPVFLIRLYKHAHVVPIRGHICQPRAAVHGSSRQGAIGLPPFLSPLQAAPTLSSDRSFF